MEAHQKNEADQWEDIHAGSRFTNQRVADDGVHPPTNIETNPHPQPPIPAQQTRARLKHEEANQLLDAATEMARQAMSQQCLSDMVTHRTADQQEP